MATYKETSFPLSTSVSVLKKHADEVQKGASARLLYGYNIEWAKKSATKARAWARRYGLDPDKDVEVKIIHIVPNSYKYAPAATNMTLKNGRWSIWRGDAKKASYGKGATAMVKIKVPTGFSKTAKITKSSLVQRYSGGYAYLSV